MFRIGSWQKYPSECYRLLAQPRRRVDCYYAKQLQLSWENVSICWGLHLCTKFDIFELHFQNPHIFLFTPSTKYYYLSDGRYYSSNTRCYLDNCWIFFLIPYLVLGWWGTASRNCWHIDQGARTKLKCVSFIAFSETYW